jgi:hypothetical protein
MIFLVNIIIHNHEFLASNFFSQECCRAYYRLIRYEGFLTKSFRIKFCTSSERCLGNLISTFRIFRYVYCLLLLD